MSKKNILLIEPDYKNKYPPLGLMKISYYHRVIKKDNVLFVKGELKDEDMVNQWDRIYITTLFTFEWEEIISSINYAKTLVDDYNKIIVGGIAVSLLLDKLKEKYSDTPEINFISGLLTNENEKAKNLIGYEEKNEIDKLTPDYKILDDINYKYPTGDSYIAYMTRGCGMNCEFCAVQKLEPDYTPYISIEKQINEIRDNYGEKKNLLLMDNNVLRAQDKYFNKIIDEIIDLGFRKEVLPGRYVDFNQGLDAKLLTEEKAKRLAEIAIKPARIAFDHIEDEEIYIKAIRTCAKYGIKYFSNYLLYNADSFKGKGSLYQADSPEDLYRRLMITIDLKKEINKTLPEGEGINIYSFPMKYIPLEDTDRKYIGPKWSAKSLRAIQVMLNPTMGKGVSGESFFSAAFGSDLSEFRMNLLMPERVLFKRGKFLKRDGESKQEWIKRIQEDENDFRMYQFYDKWINLYDKVKGKEEFYNIIEDNSFEYNKFFSIQDRLIKQIYLFYLSHHQYLSLLSEVSSEGDLSIIRNFTLKEFSPYFEDIVNYVYEVNISSRNLFGFINVYEKRGLSSVLKLWVENEFINDLLLDRLEKALLYSDRDFINISLLRAVKSFFNANSFTQNEIENIKEYVVNYKENKIRDLLKENFNEFRSKLKIENKNEFAYNRIEKKIDILTTEIGKQLSLF